jgi:hypothetical protein
MLASGDEPVDDSEVLWRRIPSAYYDPHREARPISSAAFDDSSDGTPMSVDRRSVVVAMGFSEEYPRRGYEAYGLAAFTARQARDIGLDVIPAPQLDNPAHAHVTGKKTKAVKRKLANLAVLIVKPAR